MKRRGFLKGLLGSAIAAPLLAEAAKTPVKGKLPYLVTNARRNTLVTPHAVVTEMVKDASLAYDTHESIADRMRATKEGIRDSIFKGETVTMGEIARHIEKGGAPVFVGDLVGIDPHTFKVKKFL